MFMIPVILVAIGIVLMIVTYVVARRRAGGSDKRWFGKRASQAPDDARRLPYRYIDDLIFISGTSVWTGLRMRSYGDEFSNHDERETQALQTPMLLHELVTATDDNEEYLDCHELVRYRQVDHDAWTQTLTANSWHPSTLFTNLTGRIGEHLQKASPRREHYLLIRLGDIASTSAPDPLSRVSNSVIGVHDERFDTDELQKFWDRAQRYHRVAANYKATPAQEADVHWLIRKTQAGTNTIQGDSAVQTQPWNAGSFEMDAPMHGVNTPTHVQVDGIHPETGAPERSYIATMVLTGRPEQMTFNANTAFAKKLAQLRHPPEISWRYRVEFPQVFKKKFENLRRDLIDEETHRKKAGANPDIKFERRLHRAEELHERIEGDEESVLRLHGSLRFVVSAPSVKELNESVNEVKRVLANIQLRTERPRMGQWRLLEEQLPGDPPHVNLGILASAHGPGLGMWEREHDEAMPGIALMNSDHQVGDQTEVLLGRTLGGIGPLIAYTQSTGAPVHFSPRTQLARNNGAGVAILGASGSGKSTLALLMFFWKSESGAQVVALDPKNDFERFAYYLAFGAQVTEPGFWDEARRGTLGTDNSNFQPINPEFWDATEIIDLARGGRGLLDPWRVTDTYDEGELLAHNILEVLFPVRTQRSVVTRAMREMRSEYLRAHDTGEGFAPALGRLASYLQRELELLMQEEQRYEIREQKALYEEVIDKLDRATRMRFVKLLFGDPDSAETAKWDSSARRRTIITMQGFQPPKHEDPTLWSDEERAAAAALNTVMHCVNDMFNVDAEINPVTGKRGTRPRAVFVDEGYMLARTQQGRALLATGLRQGRSLGWNVVYIGQQPKDVASIEEDASAGDEAEQNQFATVFTFAQKSASEARASLKLLRMATHDSSSEMNSLATRLLESGSGGQLHTGVCAMRDADSRVSTIVVDTVFAELARASQTNGTLRESDHEVPVPLRAAEWAIDETTLNEVRTGIFDRDDPEWDVINNELNAPKHEEESVPPATRSSDEEPTNAGDSETAPRESAALPESIDMSPLTETTTGPARQQPVSMPGQAPPGYNPAPPPQKTSSFGAGWNGHTGSENA